MNTIIYIDLLTNMLSFEDYIKENYDTIRSEYEEMLIDQWYCPQLVDEVDDWREERKEQDYFIYKNNLDKWKL